MPIVSTPDHELNIVYTICSSLMTLQDIEHYQYTTWLEPSIYGYNELFDFSDSDFSQISFSDLITIAQTASKLYMLDPDSRFAFVTYTSHHQSLADFYIAAKASIKGPSRDIKSFDDKQTAMDWLTEKYR